MSLYGNFKKRLASYKGSKDLLAGTFFANIERPCPLDTRIKKFLDSFKDKGWISVEIGFWLPKLVWDPRFKESDYCNMGDSANIIIRDGEVLNPEDLEELLWIIDLAGIEDPLPEFNGEMLTQYALSEDKKSWELPPHNSEEYFYIYYYNVD